jgi:hypothetical protein
MLEVPTEIESKISHHIATRRHDPEAYSLVTISITRIHISPIGNRYSNTFFIQQIFLVQISKNKMYRNPPCLWNTKTLLCGVHKRPTLGSIRSQLNPLHPPTLILSLHLSLVFLCGFPTKIFFVFLISIIYAKCFVQRILLDLIHLIVLYNFLDFPQHKIKYTLFNTVTNC